MVSEIMLQQTQVSRVMEKYKEFISLFPTVESLALASLKDVLIAWQGMGYNRRAKYLKVAAEAIVKNHNGKLPQTEEELLALAGIGRATARAIMTYAYNKPVVFIETNIRTVFIHQFFSGRTTVSDSELIPFIEQSLDTSNPREWYWALMDYGAHLKKTVGNLSRQSNQYSKQSRFEGSRRQVRGRVLDYLRKYNSASAQQLSNTVSSDALSDVLAQLVNEGLLAHDRGRYSLSTE